MLLILDLFGNLALLTLMGLGVYLVENSRTRLGPVRSQVLLGLVFGVAAFLVTAMPLALESGVMIDTRAGPIIVAGVVAGPIGAFVAALLGALSRFLVGGSFVFSGVVVYFVYAFSGWALARTGVVRRSELSRPATVAILAAATFLGAAAMGLLIQPPARALLWLREDLPLILAANLLSVVCTILIVATASLFLRRTVEVRDLNERLELARSAGRFGIWDYDILGDHLHWDRRAAELHGLSQDILDGTYSDWSQSVHPDDLEDAEAAFRRSLNGNAPYSVEYRVRLADGAEGIVKTDALVLRDEDGRAIRVVGTNLDLTDLRRAEADLAEARSIAVQAQKFDTIGKMTGGVAHDFNNILAIIMGNQELLRDMLARPRPNPQVVDELIEASLQATRRGADLTQNLLAYARQARLTPEPLDLNEVVRQTDAWLRRTIESHVEIECILSKGTWLILADRASLQSALINLVMNARDALDGPGRVTIETANVELGQDCVTARGDGMQPGRYAMLSIRDTGPGIPWDLLNDIFDPFMTTKPVGKGTGLGLSMVQGFVTQSGGAIRVRNAPGDGVCFDLYFPVAAEERASPGKDGAATETALAKGERILVVDDQEGLLTVMEHTLRDAGYDVVTATSGDAALDIFRTAPGFNLVATDIVMPGLLQGPGLAEAIREIDPGMRVIFFSGYAHEAMMNGTALRSDDISLMKPVAKSDLLSAVRLALKSPAAPPAKAQD